MRRVSQCACTRSSSIESMTGVFIFSPRNETTGESHSYKPGPLARAVRAVFATVTPSTLKKRIAMRMQSGMEKAETLEREQLWLKTHGSPLQVMGLPDHAELVEVRARYRNLVLETHPDTASSSTGESDYAILQSAYRMAVNPSSLWHRNGSSPALYRQLLEHSKEKVHRVDKVKVFAIASYTVMGVIGIFFAVVIVRSGLEFALQFFDPEFYRFMVAQEKEEERKRMAGEEVDKDPKRLAPTAVKKLLFPGRYIHGQDDPAS